MVEKEEDGRRLREEEGIGLEEGRGALGRVSRRGAVRLGLVLTLRVSGL
jgi:hypothetical protein